MLTLSHLISISIITKFMPYYSKQIDYANFVSNDNKNVIIIRNNYLTDN